MAPRTDPSLNVCELSDKGNSSVSKKDKSGKKNGSQKSSKQTYTDPHLKKPK